MTEHNKITTYAWEDCTIGFDCPECGEEVIVDSQNEPYICLCGNRFYLSARVWKVVEVDGKREDVAVG